MKTGQCLLSFYVQNSTVVPAILAASNKINYTHQIFLPVSFIFFIKRIARESGLLIDIEQREKKKMFFF